MSSVTAEASVSTDRIRSLDGLRGLAALVVVFDHVLLLNPALATPVETPPSYPSPGTTAWFLVGTPLHLLWAGSEAVFIFFVLSGLVLALPHLGHRRISEIDWARYYPRRITRLYVPVLAALFVAVPLMLALGRTVINGAPWWYAPDHFDLSAGSVLSEATLLGTPGRVIPALWSLKWEVVFSLLLPAFLLGAKVGRRRPAVATMALFATMLVGIYLETPWLIYLPIFGLGVVLAANHDRVAERAGHVHDWQWGLLSVAAVAFLLNKWLISGVPALSSLSTRGRFLQFTVLPASLGAMIAVVLAWQWAPLARFLDSGPVHWLGVRSYSLYLIHLPLVVVVANAFSGWNPWSVPIVVASSLVAAHVFHHVVEVPSIRWSRAVGRWASGRTHPSDRRAE